MTWAVHATARVSRCLGCVRGLMSPPCPDRPPRTTEGAAYHNIPLAAVTGRKAIADTIILTLE
jgi:hypothetical protein